jgi:hypothetical protein
MQHRSESKPYQLVMKKKNRPQAPCLKELLHLLMVAADKEEGRKDVPQPKKQPARALPVTAPSHTNEETKQLKIEQLEAAVKEEAPEDDAQLSDLADRFVGKLFWDCDEAPFPTCMVHETTTSGPTNKLWIKSMPHAAKSCVVTSRAPTILKCPAGAFWELVQRQHTTPKCSLASC